MLCQRREAHQDPWVAGQNGGGVGGFGEASALEALPDPGVRHRQVDLGVAVVEWVSLDRRGAVVAGELDRAGDEGVRDAHLSVSRAYADAPQRPDRQVIEVRDLAVAGEGGVRARLRRGQVDDLSIECDAAWRAEGSVVTGTGNTCYVLSDAFTVDEVDNR